MNAVCLEGSGRLHVPSVPNRSSSSSGLDIVVHVDSMEPSSVSNHRDDQDSIVCDTLPDEDSDHQPPPETRGSIPPEEREARLRQVPDDIGGVVNMKMIAAATCVDGSMAMMKTGLLFDLTFTFITWT